MARISIRIVNTPTPVIDGITRGQYTLHAELFTSPFTRGRYTLKYKNNTALIPKPTAAKRINPRFAFSPLHIVVKKLVQRATKTANITHATSKVCLEC